MNFFFFFTVSETWLLMFVRPLEKGVKASHLILITILLPFDKAVLPLCSTVYDFYNRYSNNIKH